MARIDLIQIRRDTAANWTSVDPILALAEFGVETDTNNFKIGNGTNTWSQLAYFNTATTPEQTNPIENEYTDINSAGQLLADQGNQTTAFFQYVADASADPNVVSGDAYYEKLPASTGSLSDYRLLNDDEVTVIQGSNSWRTFRVDSVNDDTTPLTSVSNGRIGFDYNTGTDLVTSILFDRQFTKVLEYVQALSGSISYKLQIYSQSERRILITEITSFVTVGQYLRAVVNSTIDRTVLSANDRVEVFFDVDVAGGGGGSSITAKTGTTMVFTEDAIYNATTPLTSGALTLDDTGAVLGATVWNYCDKYIPSITGTYKKSGNFSANALNLLMFTYDGNDIQLSILLKEYLATPNINFTPSFEALTLSGFEVPNATSYSIKFNTVDDEGSASAVPGYDGTSLSYEHTGLTNGTTYYYFINAFANGYFDSLTGTGNDAPQQGNTLIGNLAAEYPTASALATRLSITEPDITNFVIYDTVNISCDISANYALNGFNSAPDNVVTFWEDTVGSCIALNTNCFNGSSIQRVNFVGNLSIATAALQSCTSLVEALFPNYTGDDLAFITCTSLFNVQAPVMPSIASASINQDNESMDYIYYPALVTGNSNAYAFGQIANNFIIDLPLLTSVGQNNFRTSPGLKKTILPEVTDILPNNSFRDSGVTELVIPKCTNIGNVVTNSSAFLNVPTGGTAYVDPSLQTNNGGGRDGDIVYLEDTRGWTIVYVTDFTLPSAISDLSVSNITGTTFDLSFSTPASTNTIIHYDLFIDFQDGRGFIMLHGSDEFTTTGDTITIPSGYTGVDLQVKARTIDEFYNRSGFSNEITVAIP